MKKLPPPPLAHTKTRTIWELMKASGKPVTSSQLASLTGFGLRECSAILHNLMGAGHVTREEAREPHTSCTGGYLTARRYTASGSAGPPCRDPYRPRFTVARAFNGWLKTA